MEERIVDLSKTVHDLCTKDPNIAGILAEAGFSDILKPGMLQTAGRFMTIHKGAAMKHIDIQDVREIFVRHGYTVKEDSNE